MLYIFFQGQAIQCKWLQGSPRAPSWIKPKMAAKMLIIPNISALKLHRSLVLVIKYTFSRASYAMRMVIAILVKDELVPKFQ